LEKNEGKGKTPTTTSTNMQLDDFAMNLEKDYSLVYFLSTSKNMRSMWLFDIGASRHMTKAHEIFSILTERDCDLHVQLGDDSKYVVRGDGTITFHIDSRGLLYSQDVLYVPGLKNNFLSVSSIEDRGFSVTF
jgi:hypothetical protein